MFSKKEFAIDSNLRFISRKIFMLSRVENEKSFITSGPGPSLFTNRITGHYKLYQWRPNAQIKLPTCGMNLNLCILQMLEDTFSIRVAQYV